MGARPQIFFLGGGLKTTHCALGGDAWRVTENYFAGYGTVQLRRFALKNHERANAFNLVQNRSARRTQTS